MHVSSERQAVQLGAHCVLNRFRAPTVCNIHIGFEVQQRSDNAHRTNRRGDMHGSATIIVCLVLVDVPILDHRANAPNIVLGNTRGKGCDALDLALQNRLVHLQRKLRYIRRMGEALGVFANQPKLLHAIDRLHEIFEGKVPDIAQFTTCGCVSRIRS